MTRRATQYHLSIPHITQEDGTHYIACFHVRPNRLFTAAPMLNTRDVNQNEFTALASGVLVISNENCMVVAVTAEKKVATVLRLSRFWLACFCANRIVGTPMWWY